MKLYQSGSSVLGVPFYVMEKVTGWVPSDFPPYHVAGPLFEAPVAERQRLWWNAVETLARIHTLDWRSRSFEFFHVPPPGQAFAFERIASLEYVTNL